MPGALSETTRRRVAVARRMGVAVSETPFVDLDGKAYTAVHIECGDNERAIELFNAFAHSDAQCSRAVQELAARFRRVANAQTPDPTRRDRLVAERIHRFIRDNVRFQPEDVETSRSPELTIKLGWGDCDDHACLAVALALAAGLRARLCPVRDTVGRITHAVPVVEVAGVSYWSETTVDAHFGEHPREAVQRLDAQRSDIRG